MKTSNGHIKMHEKEKAQLPGWVLVWFYVTAIICTWDATFIMLRPYTLPGGSLAIYWYLYKYYVTIDQRYQDTKDAFVFAQSLLNYVEVVVNIVTIVMHYKCSRHTTITAFMVSVMTFWKTILYFLMFSEFCAGLDYRQGNSALEEFILVVIPNGVWIILPFLCMVVLWNKMIPEGVQNKAMISVTNGFITEEHAMKGYDGIKNGHSNGHTNGVYTNGGNGSLSKRKVK